MRGFWRLSKGKGKKITQLRCAAHQDGRVPREILMTHRNIPLRARRRNRLRGEIILL